MKDSFVLGNGRAILEQVVLTFPDSFEKKLLPFFVQTERGRKIGIIVKLVGDGKWPVGAIAPR